MKFYKVILLSMFVLFLIGTAKAQVKAGKSASSFSEHLKSSAAFGEVILRRAELESTLEATLETYTEEYPKVKEIRYELMVLDKEMERLKSIAPTQSGKLTVALGKLVVRKAEIATDLWSLTGRFGKEYPDVKRATKKLEIFEKAIKQIL